MTGECAGVNAGGSSMGTFVSTLPRWGDETSKSFESNGCHALKTAIVLADSRRLRSTLAVAAGSASPFRACWGHIIHRQYK